MMDRNTALLYRTGNFGTRSRAGGRAWRYVLRRVGHSSIAAFAGGSPGARGRGDEHSCGPSRGGALWVRRRGTGGLRQGGRARQPLGSQHVDAGGSAGSAGRADGPAGRRHRRAGRSRLERERLVVRRRGQPGDGGLRPPHRHPAGRCAARRRRPARGRSRLFERGDRAVAARSQREQGFGRARRLRPVGGPARGQAVRARIGGRDPGLVAAPIRSPRAGPRRPRAGRRGVAGDRAGRASVRDQLRRRRGRLPVRADGAPAPATTHI